MLQPNQVAGIDAVVRTVMRETHVAGCSVGIARGGRIIFLKGYGYADLASRRAPDGYTIYRAGSITKQFTAAAILRLADRNAISLGAPLGSYLPGLGSAGNVTVAELLAQQSGIPSYTDPGANFASALTASPAFQPGTSWAYSNTNYLLLGMLVASQTHETYANALDRSIFHPLHLRSTAYGVPPYAKNVATGYRYESGRYVPMGMSEGEIDRVAGAGALATNVVDLLHWLDALQNGSVVSVKAFAAMTHRAPLRDGALTNYGFGFFVRDWYGWHVAEHPGNIDGFSADDALVLEDGLELAVLSNADRISLIPLTKSIAAIVDPPKDPNLYADRPRPPENENPEVTAAVNRVFLELQQGKLDETLVSSALYASFTSAKLRQTAADLVPLGKPTLVEFIERTQKNGLTYEKYRLSFASARQYWMTLGYRQDGRIDALTLEPDDD